MQYCVYSICTDESRVIDMLQYCIMPVGSLVVDAYASL